MTLRNDHDLRLAQEQLGRGQVLEAIESLAELLGEEPDNADAHALLALCLVRRKRLHAAGLEAHSALQLAPENAFAHIAAASVASAKRRFKEAKQHLLTAASLEGESSLVERELARLHQYWGQLDDALRHVSRALQLDPDDADTLSLDGEIAFDRGESARAMESARRSLAIEPEHVDALVLMGNCELRAGRVEQAREHALWALQLDPEDAGALTLLCSIKARSSPLLGLWWRFQTMVASGGSGRTILLLVSFYLAYRVSLILLADQGQTALSRALPFAWLAFCAYTWVAPGLFAKSMAREMKEVRLRPEF